MNIFITGATSGIGKSLVEYYGQQGHTIFAAGRSLDKLQKLAGSGDIHPVVFDVTDYQAALSEITKLPEMDLAILNAGDCEYIKDATQFDAELFERIININLVSVAYQIQALMPKLLAAKQRSQLILMGSAASICPLPQAEAYGASKAGIAYLADTLNLDLKASGIDVSRISPGFVKTPLTDKNHFSMPFIMSSEQAVTRIVSGIEKRQPHIRFPKRLIWFLKCFSFLPVGLRHRLLLGSNNKEVTQ